MSSKINLAFFNAYLELNKVCARRLDISRGGVSAYIGRLVEYRFAPERNEVLSRLIRYRNYRNVIAHEENAIADLSEMTKADIRWLNKFARSVSAKRDPVSRYERKARIFSVWRKVRLVLIALLAISIVVAGTMVVKKLGL